MGEPSSRNAAAQVAHRDLVDQLERGEVLLDAGYAGHGTGTAALLVTKGRLLWRLVEPETCPVLTLAFDEVRSIVVDNGMNVRLVCRPEGGQLDAHSFEFQPEDAGLRLIVLDLAARALRRRRSSPNLNQAPTQGPQLSLGNRPNGAE
jgi:hypothetical protein